MYLYIILSLSLVSQNLNFEKINNYIESLGSVYTGVSVYNCNTEQEIYSYNSDYRFTPASVEKLITIAGGFLILGSEYRFKTYLFTDSIVNGQAYNLYIKGGGDPGFNSIDINTFVEDILDNNINIISGDIIVDESFVDTTPYGNGWMWDEGFWAYSSPISALSCNGNYIDLTVNVSPDTIIINFYPNSEYVEVENNLYYSDEHNYNVNRFFNGEKNIILLEGSVNRDIDRSVSVVNPALFAGFLLKKNLEDSLIIFNGEIRKEKINNSHELISVIESSPFYKIADSTLNNSINLASELIIRRIGVVNNIEGTEKDGLDKILNELNNLGLRTNNIVIKDGSGLSRYNILSPKFLVHVLNLMLEQSNISEYFYRSLPIMGVEGTVSSRLRNIANRRVRAKTGTLSRVCCLAGYVETTLGDTLSFSIMMNNYTTSNRNIRDIQDSIVNILLNI